MYRICSTLGCLFLGSSLLPLHVDLQSLAYSLGLLLDGGSLCCLQLLLDLLYFLVVDRAMQAIKLTQNVSVCACFESSI